MENKCRECGKEFGKEFGKRRRCYSCQPGKPKTGVTVNCKQCGKEFYVQQNVKADTKRNSGTFCSLDCKHADLKGKQNHRARPDENLIHSAGYVLVWKPEHPRAAGSRVFEHILVMEKALGRFVSVNEHIHHLDHNRQNNDISNLQLLTSSEHALLHGKERKVQFAVNRVTIRCAICQQEFVVKPSRAKRKYCSLDCRYKGWGIDMQRLKKEKNTK